MARLFKIHKDGTRELKEQGQRVEAIQWTEDGKFDKIVGSVPTVGCSVLVGSVTARSYSSQDYWLTTKVTEILEEKKTDDGLYEYVRFRTENSEYEITI
jgi:GTP1/Obg family GTP-binding protein